MPRQETIQPPKPRPQHQNSYKLVFTHREAIQGFLTGFGPPHIVSEIDPDTLECVNASFVSDDLRDREDDVIWRVRWKGRWLYLYILIEFQSTVARFMALRLLVYIGLLWQDLLRTGVVKESEKLPPVLPIVLYNGTEKWTAPLEVADLVEPTSADMVEYTPHLRYALIDEGAYSQAELEAIDNVAADMFAIEKSQTGAEIGAVVSRMDGRLTPEQVSLRRAITMWVQRVVLATRMPDVRIPEVQDLVELKNMLDDSRLNWQERWVEQGVQQGVQQGLQQGVQQGESAVLLRLLDRKFGPLNERSREQVAGADAETLLEWAERFVTAGSLEEVLS